MSRVKRSRVKRRIWWLAVAALLSASGLRADTVQGYVVNPATGARVGDTSVAFLVSQDGQLSEILRKSTDEEGRFAFSGPFISPGLTFVLVALYQGVSYPSSELRVGDQKEIILEVYDPTSSGDQIQIAQHQLFLLLGETNVEVAQIVHLENRGDRAYAGQGQGQERRVTEFALPPGAFNLQSLSGSLTQVSETQAFDTQPLPPGPTQVAFTFEVDPEQLDGAYFHQAHYPTQALEVFVHPADTRAEAPFTDQGEVAIQGKNYRRLRLENLAPGQRVRIPVPLPRSLRWTLKWVALGLAAAAALALVVLRTAAGPPRPVPFPADPQALEAQRRDLLQQLARLDDAQAGREGDRGYRAARERLLHQATLLYRLLEEQDGRR